MSRDTYELLARRYFENATLERMGAMEDLLDANIVFHSTFLGRLEGRAAVQAAVGGLLTAFPDHRATIEDVLVDGNKVTVRHTHHGTHTGPLGPIPPTGQPIAIQGIEIMRFENGRIVEFWHLDDFLGLLQQIGVVPAVGQ